MWHAAVRDLLWRRRRYLISIIGCSLVFTLSLVMTAISNSFPVEIDGVFDHVDATGFVVPEGMSGPLTGIRPFDVGRLPAGVEPMALLIQTAEGTTTRVVAVLGPHPASPA